MSGLYVGIDNGLDGAITVLDKKGKILQMFVMPSFTNILKTKTKKGNFKTQGEIDSVAIKEFFDMGATWSRLTVLIEKPAGSKGVKPAVSMAASYYTLKTIFKMHGVTPLNVTALRWQKTFWTKPRGCQRDTKDYAAEAAKKIWPDEDWLATPRCSTVHDGLVDSALIAEYARKTVF